MGTMDLLLVWHWEDAVLHRLFLGMIPSLDSSWNEQGVADKARLRPGHPSVTSRALKPGFISGS